MIQRFIATISKEYYYRNGGMLLLTNVISSIVNFGTVYFLANFIPADVYGSYKYMLSIASLLSITALQGLNQAIMQAATRGDDVYIFAAINKKIRYGMIGALAGILISGYYFWQGNLVLGSASFVVALGTPFYTTYTTYRAYLNGKKQYRTIASSVLWYSLGFFTILALTTVFTDNLIVLLVSYFSSTTALNYLLYRYTTRHLSSHETGGDTSAHHHYGMHMTFIQGIDAAAGALHGIVLWHTLTPVALPVYYLAIAPIEQIRPIFRVAEELLLPRISEGSWRTGSLPVFIRRIAPFALLIIAATVLYIAIAPILFYVLFPNYLDAIWYSQLFALTMVFTALNTVLMTILKARTDITALHFSNYLSVTWDIICSIPAIVLFGILGLIISVILKKIVLLVGNTYLAFRPHQS